MKNVLLLIILLISVSTYSQQYLELDNDTLCLKLDLSRGGAICYISESGSERNLVNIYDEGRYIQQSYYAGKLLDRREDGQNPAWSPWSWNPIQVGDSYNNRAEILDSRQEGNSLYVKCIPMLWDMNNKPAEAVMEQWVSISNNRIKVHNKLSCHRSDKIYGKARKSHQELPAVYPISALSELYAYFGASPFTKDTLSKPEVIHLEDGFWGRYNDDMVTEHWMAFVDKKLWGMAVYSPSCTNFLAGMSQEPGYEANDAPTSYIAPVKYATLERNSIYEYDYYILIGELDQMRSEIYNLKKNEK